MLSYQYLKRTYEYEHEYEGDIHCQNIEFEMIYLLYSLNYNDNMKQIMDNIVEKTHDSMLDNSDSTDNISTDIVYEDLEITNYKNNKKFLKKIKNRNSIYCFIDYKSINNDNIELLN